MLELGAMFRSLSGGMLDAGDIKQFGTAVRLVAKCLRANGEDQARWLQYIQCADQGVYHSYPVAIERMNIAIVGEIERRYAEAKDFLSVHGAPPAAGQALRFSADTPQEDRRAAVDQQAEHRYAARYVAEIDANRAKMALAALRKDEAFAGALRDAASPNHAAAVEQIRSLQRTIDHYANFDAFDRE